MRRNKGLLRDGANHGRAAVVANGAVFAQAPHLPAAPAEPLLLFDLLRHESRRHVGQDGIGGVGGGRKGGALPLLLLLLLSPEVETLPETSFAAMIDLLKPVLKLRATPVA